MNTSTPILQDDDAQTLMAGNYGYTAPQFASLGSNEYTLATIAVDVSGSVEPFHGDLENMLKLCLEACKKSPRADNLMLRVLPFNHEVNQELHGFRLLSGLNPNDYTKKLQRPSGGTSLYDATIATVEVTEKYGEDLVTQGISANAVVFIVTDGCDEHSMSTLPQVTERLKRVVRDERIESIKVVLIGIYDKSTESRVVPRLEEFAKAAGIDQFVSMDRAKAGSFAKLAGFVSNSVSSTSQALGTGGPSKNLAATF